MKKLFLLAALALMLTACSDDEQPSSEDIKVVEDFQVKADEYVAAAKGVVKNIEMKSVNDSDIFTVYVYLDEQSWVAANESEKGSVAATLNRQMGQLADPNKIYVTLMSYQNGDKLAEPKLAGDGYKIIR